MGSLRSLAVATVQNPGEGEEIGAEGPSTHAAARGGAAEGTAPPGASWWGELKQKRETRRKRRRWQELEQELAKKTQFVVAMSEFAVVYGALELVIGLFEELGSRVNNRKRWSLWPRSLPVIGAQWTGAQQLQVSILGTHGVQLSGSS